VLAAEQERAAQAEAEQQARQREQEMLEQRQRLEAQLESKQRELQKSTEAEEAKIHAAEQAARAAKAVDSVPGCYVRIPSGCLLMRSQIWKKDTWAEKHGVDKKGCEKRKSVWDSYCDSKDTEMAFVPDESQ